MHDDAPSYVLFSFAFGFRRGGFARECVFGVFQECSFVPACAVGGLELVFSNVIYFGSYQ